MQQLCDLTSPTAWLGRSKRANRIIALLEQIDRQGEPAAACAVASFLFESSRRIRIRASQTVHQLLSRVSPDQLLHLCGAVGCSWGWEISAAWDKLTPNSVSNLLVDLDSRTAVLGLLSFHRNGYVRQEAVRLLASETSGVELRYLLICQNDWVNVVAVESQAAVSNRLVPNYLPHFIRCLPLVVRLLAFTRRDLSRVFAKVIEMLVQPQHDAQLADAIRAMEPIACRQLMRGALDMAGAHRSRMIQYGLSSTDAILRLICASRVGQILSAPELCQTTMLLQRDQFMPVRREGFRIDAASNPNEASNIWKRALLDSHATIRDLARYSLGRIEAINFAAFYRRHLSENDVSLSAVSGLAECGDDTDVTFLRSLLIHPRARFRRVAIRGIARIAREGSVDDLVRLLRDRSPSVVHEARIQLEAFPDSVPGETLFALANEADSDHAKQCAVRMIFNKGKWPSLPWLIRVAFSMDESTAPLARKFIEAWFTPPLCNRVFTKPLAAEKMAIDEAIDGLSPHQGDPFQEQVTKWIQSA